MTYDLKVFGADLLYPQSICSTFPVTYLKNLYLKNFFKLFLDCTNICFQFYQKQQSKSAWVEFIIHGFQIIMAQLTVF